MHVFFMFKRPLDRLLQIEYPLIPKMYVIPRVISSSWFINPIYRYKGPVGPSDGRFDPDNPKGTFVLLLGPHIFTRAIGYLKDVLHPKALCDRCMTQPKGIWFRCAYCAMDLCEDCETVDTHNDNHAFIVFKALVSLSPMTLRTIGCLSTLLCSDQHNFVQVSTSSYFHAAPGLTFVLKAIFGLGQPRAYYPLSNL